MPEARNSSQRGGSGNLRRGTGVGRGFYVGEQGRNMRRVEAIRSILAVDENGRREAQTSHGTHRSPLPIWYRRTPLGDITAILNAIELRRERQRIVDEERRARGSLITQTSPLPMITSPANQESDVASLLASPVQASPIAPSESGLEAPAEAIKRLRPCRESGKVSSSSDGPKEKNLNLSNLDEVEKVLMENLKKIAEMQVQQKPERSKLMLMR